jgi:hypothetical protein
MDNNAKMAAVVVGEHADKILALLQAGFFDMRTGSIEVHFDNEGKIRKINKHIVFNVV